MMDRIRQLFIQEIHYFKNLREQKKTYLQRETPN